jgi:putative peptide zinc metalloprotease protein
VLACALDPAVLPPPTVLVFQRDQVMLLGAWLLISLVTVFIHELAHLVAARAAGIPSRLGLGHRLWILVAETDMTGIWMASPRQRCLAFLAGPIVDLASAAALVLVLFGVRQHWLQPDPTLVVLIQACLFQYLARLLWQLEFYVPTDFYYVFGALFGCKNLMLDTQAYLLTKLARIYPRVQARDLSGIPTRELRVVRWFSVFWLLGRAVAFGTLFWITLPVLVGYGVMLARGVGGDGGAAAPVTEGPLFPLIAVALQTVGLLVWMRSTLRPRRSQEKVQ